MPAILRLPLTRHQSALKVNNTLTVVVIASVLLIILLGACGGSPASQEITDASAATPRLTETQVSSPENNSKSIAPTVKSSSTPHGPMEESPLDGILALESEMATVKQRLPLAVIFDNHIDSRPSSGLDQAELVYEIVVESGVTRLVGVFWRNDIEKLMPVRSARVFHLPIALELDGVLVHFGSSTTPGPADVPTSANATGVRTIDGLVLGNGPFLRDFSNERFAPHNAYTSTQKMWNIVDTRGWEGPANFESWRFKDDLPESTSGVKATEVSLDFGPWNDNAFTVKWDYSKWTNSYLRWQGGIPARDGESGKRLSAKNIVIQFVQLSSAGDGTHLLFGTIGEGEAKVFQDGIVIDATWNKPTETSRTRYFNQSGDEIEFNRGTTWVELVSTDSPFSFK